MYKLQLVAFGALVLFLTAGLATFSLTAANSLRTQGELDYGEGIVLWQAANVTDWKKAFHPVENYPHIVFHYPPLYHLTARLAATATGSLLTAGRMTSILSLIGSCLVMALLAMVCLPSGHSSAARWLGSFSAATLLFTTPVWPWARLMRVDALAVFLSITGIALFIIARRRPALAFVSFACFVAAVYTKQTMVAAPTACLLLAFVEKPRFSVFLLAFTVSAGLVPLFILQAVTDDMFLRHIVSYNQNPYYLRQVFGSWISHISRMPPLIGVVAVMFPMILFCRKVRSVPAFWQRVRLALARSTFDRCLVVLIAYFWFAAAVVTATIGKLGSNYNYFFELDLAACLISSLFLGWLVRRVSFRPRGSHALLALFLIPVFLLHSIANLRTFYHVGIAFFQPASDHSEEVVHFVQGLPGPVYSEDMTILMRAGKEIPAEPAIITSLAMTKQWDESSFVRRIEHGEFQAIVVRSLTDRELFTESVARAVQQRYYVGKTLGSFNIYLPK
jgi:hypothetical protein